VTGALPDSKGRIVSTPELLTEEEFLARHGAETRIELIDGCVVRYEQISSYCGYVAANLSFEIAVAVRSDELGRGFCNDTFVRIARNPDRVRAADLMFLSYERLGRDEELEDGVLALVPELVAEIKFPSDPWALLFGKVEDYLTLGVTAVLVVDPESRTVLVLRRDQPQQTFAEADTLTVPDVLPGFAVPVANLFA